jgi:iron complex outermembrane receptor protein
MAKGFSASLLATASVLAFAGVANAQSAAKASDVSEVVVTGSRVITNGNNMPTPVTVVTTEDLKTVHPGNLVESLNDLPVFNGSRGQATNSGTNGAAGSPASSANAVNSINLRQLGVQRALILYDGHRAAPSTADGTVDLDTIPQMLLKRVDVVTGGASAVYGSEAITGVVNFITDNSFNGLKTNIQAGVSDKSDANTFEFGIAGGKALLDGRLHVEGSYEHRKSDPIDKKTARDWGKQVYTLQGNGTAAFPYFQVAGARVSNQNATGRVNNAILGDSQFTAAGALIPFVHGQRLGAAPAFAASNNCPTCEIGGDGGVFTGQLRASLEMDQAFGRADFDFTPDIHGYATVAYTQNHSLAVGNETSNATYAIGNDNAYLSPAVKTQLGATASFNLGKIWTNLPRGVNDSHAKELFFVAGLDGNLAGWKWEAALTKSDGAFKVDRPYALDQGRFFAALDSVLVNGQPACRAAATNAAYSGCVPINPFGTAPVSAQAITYIYQNQSVETNVGMEAASGSISGSPFKTWAGDVQVALSAETRKLTYEIDSHTPVPGAAFANCTGIKFGCTATTAQSGTQIASVPEKSQKVSEAAIEAQIPLLKDSPYADSLDLNAAYRFASYDRAGDAKTWKVGLTWKVNDFVTFRSTRSRDFRAPTLDESFRAQALSAPGRAFGDTLPGNPDTAAGLNAFASTLNGGNPDLKPEFGDTFTYGFVLHPFTGFDFSIDAFNIKVQNAIFLIQGNTPAYQNACYAGGGASASNPGAGNSPYCQLIVRDATNHVTQWKQVFINLAELDTVGADIEAGYRTTIFDRPFSIRVLSTYQPKLIYKQPGIADYDYAGSSFGTNGLQSNPYWRATAFLAYKPTDTISISVQERWRSELPKVDGAPDNAAAPAVYKGNPVKPMYTTNVNVTWAPKDMFGSPEVFVNIQNLFDKAPPQAGFWGNPTPGQFGEIAFGDDVIGRYFTVGARAKF